MIIRIHYVHVTGRLAGYDFIAYAMPCDLEEIILDILEDGDIRITSIEMKEEK